jgi:uncharacterized protein (DUF1800 family)
MATADPLTQHLLRRAGFGASPADLAIFAPLPYGQAVARLVNYQLLPDDVDTHIGQGGYVGTTSAGQFSPNTVVTDARQRLLFRMLHSQRPLQEKMALFWHNYFATGYSKIAGKVGAANATRLMAAKPSEDPQQQTGQVELFRTSALGNFRQLLLAVAQDPAMLLWLDGASNIKAAPQENFGRELMELFSRGVGYYTENDVSAAARVFTGWNLQASSTLTDPASAFSFLYRPEQHDTGSKTFSFQIYPSGGSTIPARSASAGMQDGIDLIAALAIDPLTAARLMTKLYGFFVSETNAPDPAFVNELAAVYLQNDTAIAPVVEFLLTSNPFENPSNVFTRYSWPAEYVTRALKETGWQGFSVASALSPLVDMNQTLLDPPNVAGWRVGSGWFSSGAMLARMNFASTLVANQQSHLAIAAASGRSSAEALLEAALGLFTLPIDSGTAADLASYAAAVPAWTGSNAQVQTKVAGLSHLILGSPAYQAI